MNLSKYQQISQQDYEAVCGPDWPSYQDFQSHTNVAPFVYKEIDQMLPGPKKFDNPSFCVLPFYGWEYPINMACCLLSRDHDLEQIKTDMLAGRRPGACHKCWAVEDSGFKSDRQIKNETLDWYSNQDISSLYEQCELGLNQVMHYKIDTSNTCNSACVTCASHASSLWGQYEQRNGVTPQKNWHLRLDQLTPKIDFVRAKSVGFRGGEPLLSSTNFEILEQLIEHGNTECFINFTTNGSVSLSRAQKNILSKFSNINMCFSIDGTESVFEYLRFPLKWNDVLKNIDYCRNHGITVSGSFTVSNMNVFYFPQIVQWFDQNQIKFLVNPVYAPSYFSVRSLPKSVKQAIIENHSRHGENSVTKFIRQHSEQDDKNYELFRQEIAKQDLWKGIKMQNYLPEFVRLLG